MPRSRRRHHSRSRSKSHSHERDRDVKRRKIDGCKSPTHIQRRSVSSESEANESIENNVTQLSECNNDITETFTTFNKVKEGDGILVEQLKVSENRVESLMDCSTEDTFNETLHISDSEPSEHDKSVKIHDQNETELIENEKGSLVKIDEKEVKGEIMLADNEKQAEELDEDIDSGNKGETYETNMNAGAETKDEKAQYFKDASPSSNEASRNLTPLSQSLTECETNSNNTNDSVVKDINAFVDLTAEHNESKTNKTLSFVSPKKPLTPNRLLKMRDSEKKRQEKQKEKEERERKRQEERDERKRLKDQERKEREDQKLKEKEAKDKEREIKRKEKEEREEQKQLERSKRQQEIDEKNKEKQKIEEQKLKAAAAFSKFFVPKQPAAASEVKPIDKETSLAFMPFQLKSDMRLAPSARVCFSDLLKSNLDQFMKSQNSDVLYLKEISNRDPGTCGKTWPFEEDVTIVEENVVNPKVITKHKAKFFKFHENHRPAYYGTWRKKSKHIKPRNPLAQDPDLLNYDVDSDDEWEEEEEGEDIVKSEDEEKEVDNENDYEVDNDFFVPHGHLSEDEEQDEENINPELRKAKEKLLKNQFEEERKSLQTRRLKTKVLGCVWYNKEGSNVDEAIDEVFKPYAYITNGIIPVRKRSDPEFLAVTNPPHPRAWKLDKEVMPDFLRLVHGNTNSRVKIVEEFLAYLEKTASSSCASKTGLLRTLKQIAQRQRCTQKGEMFNKFCWMVNEDVQRDYTHVELIVPNTWKYSTEIATKKA